MAALYLTSISGNSGKTMLGAGLGKYWLDNGKKVGYFKPLATAEKGGGGSPDADAAFIKKLFGLNESAENLAGAVNDIKAAYAGAAQGKDIVIVEGLPLNVSASVIEALDAKVLVIHDYAAPLPGVIAEYKKMGKRLVGVVLNKVPRNKVSRMESQAAEALAQAGIKFLGAIPEDRLLLTLNVGELAEVLQAKILNNSDKTGELIENVMLGALAFDSGEEYFKRKNNKAVILKGERPDMQLAALQTSLRCLVLSGGAKPIPAVLQQSNVKKVPILSSNLNVQDMATAVDKAMEGRKFRQERKLPRLEEILRQALNVKLLDQGLGLAG
jgi:uncharacterized protein